MISGTRKGKKMAWYAELKRRQWYCINAFNAISLYIKYHELEERKKIRDREKLNLYLSFIKSACLATHAEEAMDRISDVEKIMRRL